MIKVTDVTKTYWMGEINEPVLNQRWVYRPPMVNIAVPVPALTAGLK